MQKLLILNPPYALHHQGALQLEPSLGVAQTALQELIFLIYANQSVNNHPNALNWLRRTIFTILPLSPSDKTLLKVAAKRTRLVLPFEFQSLLNQAKFDPQSASLPDWKNFAQQELTLLASLPLHEQNIPFHSQIEILRYLEALIALPNPISHRPVSAALVSAESKILAHSINTNARIKPMHAETNLVRQWIEDHRCTFPQGSTLWVTLKPCRMCLAQLKEAFGETPLRVHYFFDDPGPHASDTVLKPMLSPQDVLLKMFVD